ncbi:MAG: phage major capsid protein, partial [Gammaproteobacteria bacterium]|nr:phage major capsid protein [Gammaproteobacteria bacterium]
SGAAQTDATLRKSVGGHAPTIITKKEKDEDFQGQNFTRMTIAKALARETGVSPIAIAEKRWGRDNARLVDVIKADVAGHGSGTGEAGAELITSDRYTQDFINFLYGKTVYNQLPLREVPANITIGAQDGAATGYWVGESKAIPATLADFNSVSLTPLKVAALAVASKEWLRDASPSAEMLVRDSLVQAAVQRIDTTFLSTTAASAGVSPAGILNNIAGTTSAGTDGDSVANDFKELMYRFTQAKNSGGQYIVMNPALATGLALLRNALDQYEFPNISEEGGSIFGKPVVTGDNVNANHLIMLKPSDIYRIASGSLEVSMSDAATIEMADNPAADTDTPTAPTGKAVSMFQTESVAFKVVLPLNFQRRRESAVAWISDADYGGAIST